MHRRTDAAGRHEREREIERRAVEDGKRNARPQGEKAFDAIVSVVGFGALIWWLFF
jgi:hypothetical protein